MDVVPVIVSTIALARPHFLRRFSPLLKNAGRYRLKAQLLGVLDVNPRSSSALAQPKNA
jgi:hypothetical protein